MRIRTEKKYVIRRAIVATAIVVAIASIVNSKHTTKTTVPVGPIHTATVSTIVTTTVHHEDVQAVNKDLITLAKLIQSEAAGESYAGKLAVGTVVMNRVANGRWGDTVEKVIYAKHQFNGVGTDLWNKEPNEECIKAANEVLNKGYRSFNASVVYYFNPKIATDKAFMKTVKVVATVGNHNFGTERSK